MLRQANPATRYRTLCRFRCCWAACGIVAISLAGCFGTKESLSTQQNASQPAANASFSGAKAAPPDENAISPPWRLIGLNLDDAQVKAYLSQAQGTPDRYVAEGYGVFVGLNRDGVELSAETNGLITTVFIYAARSKTHDQYVGRMPFGLSWDMTRAEVEKVMGRGERTAFTHNPETGDDELDAHYSSLDGYVRYEAKSERDMRAKLHFICIKIPDL